MSLDYESQIQKYEDIIRKNEVNFEHQNQEISHARRAVLSLEQQLRHFNKDFRRYREENVLLKQDKRNYQATTKKMEKIVYGGNKRTPTASGTQRITLPAGTSAKPMPSPMSKQSGSSALRKLHRTGSFQGNTSAAISSSGASLRRGHSTLKHHKKM